MGKSLLIEIEYFYDSIRNVVNIEFEETPIRFVLSMRY